MSKQEQLEHLLDGALKEVGIQVEAEINRYELAKTSASSEDVLASLSKLLEKRLQIADDIAHRLDREKLRISEISVDRVGGKILAKKQSERVSVAIMRIERELGELSEDVDTVYLDVAGVDENLMSDVNNYGIKKIVDMSIKKQASLYPIYKLLAEQKQVLLEEYSELYNKFEEKNLLHKSWLESISKMSLTDVNDQKSRNAIISKDPEMKSMWKKLDNLEKEEAKLSSEYEKVGEQMSTIIAESANQLDDFDFSFANRASA